MRINVYSQELTDEVVRIEKVSNTGRPYVAAQLILHSSPMLHHPPADDDRSAVTFWLPSSADRRESMARAFERMAAIFRQPAPLAAPDETPLTVQIDPVTGEPLFIPVEPPPTARPLGSLVPEGFRLGDGWLTTGLGWCGHYDKRGCMERAPFIHDDGRGRCPGHAAAAGALVPTDVGAPPTARPVCRRCTTDGCAGCDTMGTPAVPEKP